MSGNGGVNLNGEERESLFEALKSLARPVVTDLAGPESAADHHEYLDRVAESAAGGPFALCVRNPALSAPGPLEHGGPWSDACHFEAVLRARFTRVWDYSRRSGEFASGADASAERLAYVCTGPRPVRRSPKVSVVMPLYNRFAYTAKALDALAANTPEDFELVLVDNASTDQTRTALTGLGGDVIVCRNSRNLGFAKACNQGALIARGEYVVFLNNDTEVRPGWLAALVDELEQNPDTGVAGGRLLYPDGTVQHAGVAVGRDLVPIHAHRGLAGDDPLVLERREFPVVTGACMAVRRRQFMEIGMFDEAFVNGHEDIDLCMRYAKAGKRVVYRPDCVVTHHESVSDGRMDKRERNLKRTMNKWRYDLVQDDFTCAVRLAERGDPAKPLVFALKIGPPDREARNWGDVYYAEGVAKALFRAGHECRIHYLDEWGKDDLDVDVVIHLSGLSPYRVKPWNVNLMWMINHPERPDAAEMERYDAVMPASIPYAEKLSAELAVPVTPLLQATDPEHFHPRDRGKEHDLVFVGNNISQMEKGDRKIVTGLLPTKHKLAVWGQGWDGVLPTNIWQGYFVEHKDLPEVYSSGRIVLNDHQSDMRENGFVNNRTFDAAACGCVVLSDRVERMGEVLGVARAGSREELRAMADEILADPGRAEARAAELRREVLENHTFDRRAAELEMILGGLDRAFDRASRARRKAFDYRKEPPFVSVLMATHDRPEYLPRAVKSVLGQTHSNLELMLVNDGGGSVAELIEELGDPRVRLIELPEHRGKGRSINTAFSASCGEFIAHLDDDDIWYPDHLDSLLMALMNIRGLEMAYSDAYKVDLEEDGSGGFSEAGREVKYHHQAEVYDLLENNMITGISVVHRRGLFERAGGMDERLSVLLDWDLWRRMAALTMPHHVSRATAEYYARGGRATRGRGHLTNMHDEDRPRYFAHRARIINKKLGGGEDERLERGLAFYRKRSRAEFLAVRGDWFAANGRAGKAARAYRLAARIAPEEISVLRRLGHFLMGQGNPAEAAECFGRAAALRHAREEDYFNLAVALAYSGRIEEGGYAVESIGKRFHSSQETLLAIEKFWGSVLARLGHGPQNLARAEQGAAQ